jgi:hypothetical protein
MNDPIDALLHPVRIRIVQSLIGRTLTVAGLRRALPDVPQASLYRHVNALVASGHLHAVAQTSAGGATERVFALARPIGAATPAEAAALGRDDVEHLFGAFTAALMSDFRRYLDQPAIDLARDGVGFRSIALTLDDAAFNAFVGEFRELLTRYADTTDGPGKRRRLLSYVLLPEPDASTDD